MERRKKNLLKKKTMVKKKKEREVQTLEKARHLMGLGPISNRRLTEDRTKDFESVKIEEVKELLKEEPGFNENELEELTIKDTMSKGDDFIYCAFADIQDIREIHTRIAESRNNEVLTRDFIPPQLYERFRELNRVCSEMRRQDKTIKTEVRFGATDLEVFTKTRGSKEPYR